MTRFIDLLAWSDDLSPGEQSAEAGRRFPSRVAESPLTLWGPGLPVHDRGSRLLVGVAASYSPLDLKLLDELAAASTAPESTGLHIDVFDASLASQADFELYFPGIGKVFHTPVVGLWVDGELVERGSGAAGRELAGRASGIGPRVRDMVDRHYRALSTLGS